jgi:hypothetical protein
MFYNIKFPSGAQVSGYEKSRSLATQCPGVQLGNPVSGGINTKTWSSRLGVGVGLITSPCRKTFVENPLRKKNLEEVKAHLQGCSATVDDADTKLGVAALLLKEEQFQRKRSENMSV